MSNDLLIYINEEVEKLCFRKMDIPKPQIEPSTNAHRLIIGYDKSPTGDYSCLIVGKQYFGSEEVYVANEFRNEQADEIYRYLTTPNSLNPFQNSFNEKV